MLAVMNCNRTHLLLTGFYLWIGVNEEQWCGPGQSWAGWVPGWAVVVRGAADGWAR